VTASRAARDDRARALLGGTLAGRTLSHRQSDSDRPETGRQAGKGKREGGRLPPLSPTVRTTHARVQKRVGHLQASAFKN